MNCVDAGSVFAQMLVAASGVGALLATWMILDLCFGAPPVRTRRDEKRRALQILAGVIIFCVCFAGVLDRLVDRAC